MKIVQVKTPHELQTWFWMNGGLIALDDALEILSNREREIVTVALARRRRESLARRVVSYFAKGIAWRRQKRSEYALALDDMWPAIPNRALQNLSRAHCAHTT